MKPSRLDHHRLEHCACLNVRKAARAVTRAFDAALAPSGLAATQFTLLAALAGGQHTMTGLADYLVTDRTTLTRGVRPLVRLGFVSARPGRDARRRMLGLTAAGRRKLKAVFPLWRKAQRDTIAAMGHERYARLLKGLSDVTAAAPAGSVGG